MGNLLSTAKNLDGERKMRSAIYSVNNRALSLNLVECRLKTEKLRKHTFNSKLGVQSVIKLSVQPYMQTGIPKCLSLRSSLLKGTVSKLA